jgi:hypothetical protein
MIPDRVRYNTENGKWEAKDEFGAQATVDDGFEEGTVPPGVLVEAKSLALREDKRYLPVPPGKRCRSVRSAGIFHPSWIQFQMGGRDQHNCLVASFASAMHATGRAEVARMIFERGCQLPVVKGIDRHFRKLFNSLSKEHGWGLRLSFPSGPKDRFHPLSDAAHEPVLVQFRGELNHCISFYNGLIYDSSFEAPLWNSKTNIDLVAGRNGSSGVKWSLKCKCMV